MYQNSGLEAAFRACWLSAPDFTQQPKFEITDVHISTTARGFVQNFGGVVREGRYVNRDATMLGLIAAAYSVSEDNIGGGPAWLNSDFFDVVAKVARCTTPATAKLMLQDLLAQRFGLVIQNDKHPVPRYVLTVTKSGSKSKAASGSETPGCQLQQQGRGGGEPSDLSTVPNIKVACHNLTAAGIAENLRQMAGGYFDHDVVDSRTWKDRGTLTSSGHPRRIAG